MVKPIRKYCRGLLTLFNSTIVRFGTVLWIRKYFFRIRRSVILNNGSDPNPGMQLTTDLAGSGSYLEI
jgi:hypothetical protein